MKKIESNIMTHSHIPVARSPSVNSGALKLQERIAGLRSVSNTTGVPPPQQRKPTTINEGPPTFFHNSNQDQHQQQTNKSPSLLKSMSVAAQRAAFERLDINNHQKPSNKLQGNYCEKKLSTSYSVERSNALPPSPYLEQGKWKNKLEDSERKGKMLLQKSETSKFNFFIF